ncbi:hypothetical protein BDW68DRAFT_40801 [Aspergillus falconensis]
MPPYMPHPIPIPDLVPSRLRPYSATHNPPPTSSLKMSKDPPNFTIPHTTDPLLDCQFRSPTEYIASNSLPSPQTHPTSRWLSIINQRNGLAAAMLPPTKYQKYQLSAVFNPELKHEHEDLPLSPSRDSHNLGGCQSIKNRRGVAGSPVTDYDLNPA